jgi:hypothetical protein
LEFFDPDIQHDLIDLIDGLGLDRDHILNGKSTGTASDSSDQGERQTDAELIRLFMSAESYHDPLLKLTARYAQRGVDQQAIISIFQALMLAIDDRSDRWKNRFDDIPRMVADAVRKFGQPEGPRAAEFAYANFATLESDPPPAREWIWDKWLPRGTVVALFGRGGIGKSLLVQQLATHVAHGVKLGGNDVVKSAVLGYFCEDDNEELRRRQISIASELFIDPASMTNLFLEGRAGKPNTLLTFQQDKTARPTPLMKQIRDECSSYKPSLLILDNVAQMYAGLENDRYQVTAFCNELTGIARAHNLCVLLLGHVAKAEGSEYSGSTAWEAAVRTRLWLDRTESGLLQLHRKKANYSDQDSLTLEYVNGYLRNVGTMVDAAPMMARALQPRVLEALAHYTAQEIATSNSPQARNYIVRMMIRDGFAAGASQSVLANALSGLITAGQVKPNCELGWMKPDRHPATGLMAVEEEEIGF